MGSFDIFHACASPGTDSFIWLHTIATIVGGGMAAGVWLSPSRLASIRPVALTGWLVMTACTVGVICVTIPESAPRMLVDGHFTMVALAFHILGGLGFASAGVMFLGKYARVPRLDSAIFAILNFLFGAAALLFLTSTLWSPEWWFWHIVRLTACAVGAGYVFMRVAETADNVTKHARALEVSNSQRQRALDDLLSANKKAEAADRVKSSFLGAMTHNLRSPFNSILGFSDLLLTRAQSELTEKDMHCFAGHINRSARQLLRLVNDVLDITWPLRAT